MEVSLPLGTWDGLRFFIVALPGPSINCIDTLYIVIVTVPLSLLMHEFLPLNFNFQAENAKITVFASIKQVKGQASLKHMWVFIFTVFEKVMRKQRTRTEAIRRQISLSKPKWKITKILIRQNTMRTNGQPSGQLFPKRWSLSNPNRTKCIINKHKVKHHRNSDTKNRQQRTTSELLGTVSYELLGGLN